ncbi:hypothetical protein BASA81_012849 [Batrachochytrium salamandrivorans]|nr:hypothetical protein BASA81_012849 [Batrachochytrium salamandrivorans]
MSSAKRQPWQGLVCHLLRINPTPSRWYEYSMSPKSLGKRWLWENTYSPVLGSMQWLAETSLLGTSLFSSSSSLFSSSSLLLTRSTTSTITNGCFLWCTVKSNRSSSPNDGLCGARRKAQPNACSTATERAKMLEEISDLRERIEVVHSSMYNSFLEHLFPAFEQVNLVVVSSCVLDDVNNKIRLKMLEILVRLPINDALRPYASRMLSLNLGVVAKDNEENALVSMRIIFEL